MKTFLQYIAEDLIRRFQNQMQHVVLVFPNKRASLFLNEYLGQAYDKPVWAPSYITISELFRQFSPYKVPDKIQLVCELYPIYRQLRGKTETDLPLDQFYSWGEMLLSDFDDVDKNMVPADRLFQNLEELKSLEDTSFLNQEQRQALKQFFANFQFDDAASRETEIKKEFISVWDILENLYRQYNSHLRSKGLLYEGALFREVVENLSGEDLKATCYVFVGFNVLDRAEEKLFSLIQQAGKALFYWDYDPYYLHPEKGDMEAGHFLRQNIRKFGNALPDTCFQNMEKPKQVEIIASATENAQVCHVAPWVEKNLTEKESSTAVVLCNEAMLEPVLHTLPTNLRSLNITMGFPLSSTPVFSFIKALTALHLEGYFSDKDCYRYGQVRTVLLHPYTRLIYKEAENRLKALTSKSIFFPTPEDLDAPSETELQKLFPTCDFMHQKSTVDFLTYLRNQIKAVSLKIDDPDIHEENTTGEEGCPSQAGPEGTGGNPMTESPQSEKPQDLGFTPMYKEALYTAYTLLNKLIKLVEDGILTVGARTMVRFVDQIMGAASIPFHGEPVMGLQVMGVLETRCLDFRHLLILSLNEGLLPKNTDQSSFIPYNLRRAFGMTLVEQKVAVYAYYFYRLIQRAERITFVYNNNTEGLRKGEMSRFLLQYILEHPENHELSHYSLTTEQKPLTTREITVEKTEKMMTELLHSYQTTYEKAGRQKKRFLSPSALNTYIDCPLKFYFKYVARIQVPDEVADEIDNALFGNIFHRCAEDIYNDLTGHCQRPHILKSALEAKQKDERFLNTIVDNAFKRELFKLTNEDQLPPLNGIQSIIRVVILKYVKQLLKRDIQLAPFDMLGLEKEISQKFDFPLNGKTEWIYVGGSIDRMDAYVDKESGRQALRIIDYKTSNRAQEPNGLDGLFNSENNKRQYHALQAFYYAMQVNEVKEPELNPNGLPVTPALFYIKQAAGEDYQPVVEIKGLGDKDTLKNIRITDFEGQIGEEYRSLLKAKLAELFGTATPFTQCTNQEHCKYCDFKNICGRNDS